MGERQELFVRHKTVSVRCGSVAIGGGAPVSIQTMAKTDTRDVEATVTQVREAVNAGADIVRLAVPDAEAAEAFREIRKRVRCPLVADIHFDYSLAISCLESGADKVRVNPGTIGGLERLLRVAEKAMERGAAIRIGVNSGSVEEDILEKHGGPTPLAMVESARRSLDVLQAQGISGIVVSLKSSSVRDTIRSYALMARESTWPLHVGVTEAGPGLSGVVKSAAGISTLLAMGIGDTIRVSLTGSPVEEVSAGREILQAMEVRRFGPEIISCPTCGRTEVDLVSIAREVARRLEEYDVPIKVAVMGCPVNGPGEAREADVGVACGRDGGILFARGQVLGSVPQDQIVDALLRLVAAEAEKRRRE
jgi:(E)-4-hydroxy-3-methylbut-2-enyl-diphosphate synthase